MSKIIYGDTVGGGGGNLKKIPQSDWNQADDTQLDYIKNKPDLSAYATADSVAAMEDRIGQCISNIEPPPVRTYEFDYLIDDEYFYEEHDNIMIKFDGDVCPKFKVTVRATTTQSVHILDGSSCVSLGTNVLSVWRNYDEYDDECTSYYIYCGTAVGADIGGNIHAVIEMYDENIPCIPNNGDINVGFSGGYELDEVTIQPTLYIGDGLHLTVNEATYSLSAEVTQTELDGKLDKAKPDDVTDASTEQYVYAITKDGAQTVLKATRSAAKWTVASRDGAGRIKVGDPNEFNDAANKQYVDETVANVEVDLTGYATEDYVDDEIAKSGCTTIKEISPDESGQQFSGVEFNAWYVADLSDKTQEASFLLRAYSSTYQEDGAADDACESYIDIKHGKPFQFPTSGWEYCSGSDVAPKFEALDLGYCWTITENQVMKLYEVVPQYAPLDFVYSKSEVDTSFATKQEVEDAVAVVEEMKLYQHNMHMIGNINVEYRIDAYWTVYSKIDTPATFDDGTIALPSGVDSVASGLYAFEGELCPIQTMRYDDGVYIFKYIFQAGGDYICSEMPIEEIGENFTFTDTVTQIL